ncbi:MAG TPA: zinc ribbon domain-containing protein, partial [Candidatus Glassbacteria bacterium]|nr:zinc ribbon domain-containing protein [Candidatus Glassbacteria bacterium]
MYYFLTNETFDGKLNLLIFIFVVFPSLSKYSKNYSKKQRIDEVAKETIKEADLIVVEKLKNLGKKSKAKRLLAKNIRRSIGIWNWKYWLMRLEQQAEWNRVSFRSVSPCYTSQTCPCCGHVDRKNRSGEVFQCQECGHTDNA